MTKYVNIGSILLNIKKLKEHNFWNKYTKNRNLKIVGAPDQTLFNITIMTIINLIIMDLKAGLKVI